MPGAPNKVAELKSLPIVINSRHPLNLSGFFYFTNFAGLTPADEFCGSDPGGSFCGSAAFAY